MDRTTLEMVIKAREQLSGMNRTILKIKQMKSQFMRTARSMAAYAKKIVMAFAKIRMALVKLHSAFRTLRNVALKAFTAIVALVGIPVIKFFGDLEQAMANVNTLMSVTTSKFKEMTQELINISNQTGEAAKDLSGALYDIVSAGVDSSEALKVLELTARGAKAGMTSTKSVVNASIATINAFALSTKELNKVLDLQFTTVKKGVITYEQLSTSQGKLLPSARKLNESLERMYGAFAFITKQGLSAREASTALARAYDQLAIKSEQLKQKGVEVYNEFGKFRGIVEIMSDLSGVLQGLTDEELQTALQEIGFNVRSSKAIIPLIKNVEDLKDITDEMGDSSGAMMEAFMKATDTIQFHVNRAKTNVVNAFINMGEAFREETINFAKRVTVWARLLQKFVKNNGEAIKSILLFAMKLTGVLTAIGAIGAAIFALSTPIGAIMGLVSILAGIWYLNMWNIRDYTAYAVDYVLEKWNDLKDWWKDTTWLEKVQDIGGLVLSIASWSFHQVEKICDKFKNWLKEKLDVNEDGAVTFDESWSVIINFILDKFKGLYNSYQKLKNWVKEKLDVNENEIVEFDESWGIIIDIFLDTFKGLYNLYQRFKNWVKEKLDVNEDETITFDKSIGLVIDVVLDSVEGFTNFFKNTKDFIKNKIGSSQSGMDMLLDTIYQMEGGADIDAIYGTTGFRDQGYEFGKKFNKQFFEGLVEARELDPHTEGWYRAASETTINWYWKQFKDMENLADNTDMKNLSKEKRAEWIKFLGESYCPPDDHELNQYWEGNVLEGFEKELKNQVQNNDIFDETLELALDFSLMIGSITIAFTAAMLISAIVKALVAAGILIAKGIATGVIAGGAALSTGLAIGAMISIALDPNISNVEEWKQAMIEGVNIIKDEIEKMMDKQWWIDVFEDLKSAWKEVWNGLWNWLDTNNQGKSILEKTSPMALPKMIWDFINPEERAEGGKIIGAGTGTSDSILARLSNGEFVVNAKATKRWLPLLEQINSAKGYALGGSVGSGVPSDVANFWTLMASGMGDNEALKYLATIAKDTEKFRHIVDIVSGIGDMKSGYQDEMEKLKAEYESEVEDLKSELEEIIGNQEDEKKIFEAGIDDLARNISGFMTQLGTLTGSKELGLAGGLVGQGISIKKGMDNFRNAADLLGKFTAGFGIAGAVVSGIQMIADFQKARNEAEEKEWKEQIQKDEKRLSTLQKIQENTKQTVTEMIKWASKNPTIDNTKNVQDAIENFKDTIGNLDTNFGQIVLNVTESDLIWDDMKTVKYNILDIVDGFETAKSSINDLDFDELKAFYKQALKVTEGDLKQIAQDIADGMDVFGGGELKEWSSNWDAVMKQIKTYIKLVDDLDIDFGEISGNAKLEDFGGVEWLKASEMVEAYREQIENLYTSAGMDIIEYEDEINEFVKEYADNMVDGGERIITIMEKVRGSFVSAFQGGESAFQSFAKGLESYFSTFKENIAKTFYNIDLSGLNERFKQLFGGITDKLASYTGGDVVGYGVDLINSGGLDEAFDSMVDLFGSSEDMESINDEIVERFREQAELAGMTNEEIIEALENMGLMTEEVEDMTESLKSVKNALKNAMSSAINEGSFKEFSKSMGESIYDHVKEGLINAFMESKVYQEMFEKWFDSTDISFTGNLKDDFETIQDILDNVYTDLKEAGMDFKSIVEKVEKDLKNVKNALQQAMGTAIEEESFREFSMSMGESIYENAKEGLINAFMESAIYQEMFENWFNASDIDFTGNLKEDFETIQNILDGLYGDLKESEMDFKSIVEKVEKDLKNVKNALSQAMSVAIEEESFKEFSKSMGESIYENVKEGLINAFMESAIYQEMFEKWFDTSNIDFTGNLKDDFKTIQYILDDVYLDLKEAGMDFKSIVVSSLKEVKNALKNAMNSAIEEGSFREFSMSMGQSIHDHVKDSLIDAFMESAAYQKMFEKWFEKANIQFTGNLKEDFKMIQDTLDGVYSDLKGAGMDFKSTIVPSAEEANDIVSDDYYGGNSDYYSGTEGASVTNNHYHFSPTIDSLYGDTKENLYEEFLKWMDEQKDNEA